MAYSIGLQNAGLSSVISRHQTWGPYSPPDPDSGGTQSHRLENVGRPAHSTVHVNLKFRVGEELAFLELGHYLNQHLDTRSSEFLVLRIGVSVRQLTEAVEGPHLTS